MKRPILVHIQCLEKCKIKFEELQVENDLWNLNHGDLQDKFGLSKKNLKHAQNDILKLNNMLSDEHSNSLDLSADKTILRKTNLIL